jgi:hypothetical protein
MLRGACFSSSPMRVRIVVDPVLVASTASVINALAGCLWLLLAWTRKVDTRYTSHIFRLIALSCCVIRNIGVRYRYQQGAIFTAIGMRSLNIGGFRIQAFICGNHELQHSLLGLNPLTTKGCTAEFTNRYFKLNHAACLQPILVGYKHHRPTLWRVTIPPPTQDAIAIPRAIASDPFLAHSDDDTTTASLKRDEILDHQVSSSALAPTLKRTPIYAYQDFSYAEDNYVTSGTHKVPLVHKLNKNPDTIQRVPPYRVQWLLDPLLQQTQPITREWPCG